jgi:hypothetical protein
MCRGIPSRRSKPSVLAQGIAAASVVINIQKNPSDVESVEQDRSHIDAGQRFLAPTGPSSMTARKDVKRRALKVREMAERRKTRRPVQNRTHYSDAIPVWSS